MTPQKMYDVRERLGWPRDRVARLLDCSIGLVRRWETGIVPIPPVVGEWMVNVGRWGQSLPRPPTGWRTRSARDDD